MDIFDMSRSRLEHLQALRDQNTPKLQQLLASDNEDHRQLAEACRSVVGHSTALEGQKALVADVNRDPETTDLIEGMRDIRMPALVLGVQSDILFPVWQQKEIAECLRASGNKHVTYYELDAMFGHDTFLIDRVSVGGAIKGHLELLDKDFIK